MYLGSISCMSLYFFEGDNVEYGIILSVLASIGFTGSLVFYNAFLPEISTPNNFDKISARGYSFGYVGSVILLEAMFAGPLTNASINPARSFGPALIGNHWEPMWLYLTAPFAGMALAVVLFKYFVPLENVT